MAHIKVVRRSMRPEEWTDLRFGWLKRYIYEEKFENELEAFNYLKEQIISELEKEVIFLEKEAILLFEQNEEYFFQESMEVYFEMVEIFKSYILKKGKILK